MADPHPSHPIPCEKHTLLKHVGSGLTPPPLPEEGVSSSEVKCVDLGSGVCVWSWDRKPDGKTEEEFFFGLKCIIVHEEMVKFGPGRWGTEQRRWQR